MRQNPGAAPRDLGQAIGLLLPTLPVERRTGAYDTAWLASAAISGAYRADKPATVPSVAEQTTSAADEVGEVGELALISGDEHAIKFTEVALESHRRGNPRALAAAALLA